MLDTYLKYAGRHSEVLAFNSYIESVSTGWKGLVVAGGSADVKPLSIQPGGTVVKW